MLLASCAMGKPPPARAGRVGPTPAPPPDRLDTWTVLDLLATTRRWRVNEPFVAGQTDGLSRALIACLNAKQPVPRWLREAIITLLLEALWDQPRPRGGTAVPVVAAWLTRRDTLLGRWREPSRQRVSR
jgi:hypothetical protein